MTRQWSKVRADLQRMLAPSVGTRLDVHATSYRHAHEEYGRAWFTWDGAEVYSFDDMKFWLRVHPLHAELKALGEDVDVAWERSWAIAKAEGLASVTAFRDSVDRFLGLDARAALGSDDPVVRGLAMLDRRVGRRTIMAVTLDSETHPFVRRLRELRREAEGWERPAQRVTSSDAD